MEAGLNPSFLTPLFSSVPSRRSSSSCSSGAPAAGRPHAAGSCCTGPGRTAPGAAAVGASCAGELGATGLQPRAARCSTGAGPAACAGGRGVGTASCRVRCARAGRRLVRLAGRRLVGPRPPAAFACAERAPHARVAWARAAPWEPPRHVPAWGHGHRPCAAGCRAPRAGRAALGSRCRRLTRGARAHIERLVV